MPRHSAGCSYVCMHVLKSTHAKYACVGETSTHGNVCLNFASSDLGVCYRSKFKPGDKPEKPVLDQGDRL